MQWWRGSEVEREREGGRESVNSCFLIKQQCSQLIHLICQLGEKHGRNLFTCEREREGRKDDREEDTVEENVGEAG